MLDDQLENLRRLLNERTDPDATYLSYKMLLEKIAAVKDR